jgi:hypothetical protein
MSRRNTGGAGRRSTSVPRTKSLPDPIGRVDIALQRLLELAVHTYADLPVRAVYANLQAQINMGISAVVGPRTAVGGTAKQAVQAIRAVAKQIDGGGSGGGGNAA